jgi:hypothetical protein
MPCYDPGPHASDNSEFKNKIDKLTQMLCRVCQNIEKLSSKNIIEREVEDILLIDDKELYEWWGKHQIFDNKRKNKIKEEALSKLSLEEKEVLKELGL